MEYTKLTARVDREFDLLSSIDQNNPHFQQVIKLGIKIIPLLLEQLIRNKDPWWRFSAISQIIENKRLPPVLIPEKDQGYYDRITACYLRWGLKQGLISVTNPQKTRRRKTNLRTKDLIFLVYDRGLQVTKTKPDGVVVDLKKRTWTFKEDPHAERRGPYKIGSDSRFMTWNHKWGPVGVYDQRDFRHVQAMISEITHHVSQDSKDTIEVD